MAVLHIQVNAPKYDNVLPAHCSAKVHNKTEAVILWESYIDPRTNQVVYLSSVEGRYLMLPEMVIVEDTVEHICGIKEAQCQQQKA